MFLCIVLRVCFFVFGSIVGFLILFYGLCVVVIKKYWKFLSTFIYNYLFSVVIIIVILLICCGRCTSAL